MSRDAAFLDLMARLRAGDGTAAREIYQRFARRLIALASSRLGHLLRPKVDPEDVLQSVYRSFFCRQADGHLEPENWDHLWFLLTTITVRKCGRRAEYFRAACRDVGREVPLAGGEGVEALANAPTPSEAVELTETVEQLMRGLDVRGQEMLALSLQGYTTPEISDRVGRSERTVQRLLRKVRTKLEAMHADRGG
jgi:RNA polymerase sigma-70 factor (ECF subfamily)